MAVAALAVPLAIGVANAGVSSPGYLSANPSAVTAGTMHNNIVFRYTAKSVGPPNNVFWIGVDTHYWSTPTQNTSGAGNITVQKGTCKGGAINILPTDTNGMAWIRVSNVTCSKQGQYEQIGYGNVPAPNAANVYVFPSAVGDPGPGVPIQAATVTVRPAAPDHLTWLTAPNNVFAGQPTTTQRVQVQDFANNAVTTASGSVTLALFNAGGGPSTGNVTGTLMQNVVSGVATFPGLKVTTANPAPGYQFKATYGALSARSGGFSVFAGTATQLVFLSEPADTVAGQFIDNPGGVQVAIEDQYGNIRTGDSTSTVTLGLNAPPAGVTLGGTTGQPVSSGVATFTDLSIGRSNPGNVLTATADSLPSVSADSTVFDTSWVTDPQNGGGDWLTNGFGGSQWWLFQFGAPDGTNVDPPNLQVAQNGAPATLGDLTGSGASGYSWAAATPDDRALQNPCAGNPSCPYAGITTVGDRAAGALYSTSQFTTTLSFPSAFSGTLRIYVVDWDTSNARAETLVVHDSLGDQTVNVDNFTGGAWVAFNITTIGPANVTITATNNTTAAPGSPNAVISGIFLN